MCEVPEAKGTQSHLDDEVDRVELGCKILKCGERLDLLFHPLIQLEGRIEGFVRLGK
jgi:hypothetical protein